MGLISIALNNIVKDKNKIINSIDADIEKLNDSREYAKKALTLFDDITDKMDGLHGVVESGFRGEAAEAFSNRLMNYGVFCKHRSIQMASQIAALDIKISELEKQKKKSEDAIESIRNIMEKFSWLSWL